MSLFVPMEGWSAVWTPALITTAGWWDFSDLSTMWQNTAGSTAVAANDDPIRRIDDKSGNGRNLQNSNDSYRPLYKTGGYAAFDGSDDRLGDNTFTTTGMTAMSVWLAVSVIGTGAFMLVPDESYAAGNHYILYGNSGGGGSANNNAGSPTYYKNGSLISPTNEGAVHAALSAAGGCVVEVRNVDISSWGGIGLGRYAGSGVTLNGNVYEVLLMTMTVADANRADIAAYLIAKIA